MSAFRGLRCPHCGSGRHEVQRVSPPTQASRVQRERICLACQQPFVTYEVCAGAQAAADLRHIERVIDQVTTGLDELRRIVRGEHISGDRRKERAA